MEMHQRIYAVKTKEDFLKLINEVKREQLGSKAHPFALKQITYYADPRKGRRRYTDFTIPKKSGGERIISAPVKGLKSILRYLNIILTTVYEPTEYAKGFVKGLSVADNARAHIGHNYVFNIDLKDFFPSIDKSRVWKRLTLPPFNFPSNIADIIAGLCTMEVKGDDKVRYVLPQGAPTSPIITNMICQNLDRKLGGLARRFGLTYTRYADDITFSSMHNVYAGEGEFIKELKRIVESQNFTINEAKTRLQSTRGRREVTGLTVSDKINVSQKYIRDLRQLLYIWEKYGISVATTKFMAHYSTEKPHGKKTPSIQAYIEGKLLYLNMVKGQDDSVYIRMKSKFDRLVGSTKATSFDDNELTFIDTCGVQAFERKMGGKIVISQSKRGPITLYLQKEDGDSIPISYSKLLKEKLIHSVGADASTLKGVQLSLCTSSRYFGKKEFFLMHKFIPSIINNSKKVDERLNETLNLLVESEFDLTRVFDSNNDDTIQDADIFPMDIPEN